MAAQRRAVSVSGRGRVRSRLRLSQARPIDTQSRTRHRSSASGDQYGAYASLRAEVTPPLTLEGGVRWDRSTLGTTTGSIWSPRASALYRLNDVRVGARELGALRPDAGHRRAAGLRRRRRCSRPAQRADHWLLSFEQQLGDERRSAREAIASVMTRSAAAFRESSQLRGHPAGAEARSCSDRAAARPRDGVELSLRSVHTRPMFWWASYTWSRAEDVSRTAKCVAAGIRRTRSAPGSAGRANAGS